MENQSHILLKGRGGQGRGVKMLQTYRHTDIQTYRHQTYRLQTYRHQTYRHQTYRHQTYRHQTYRHQTYRHQTYRHQTYRHQTYRHQTYRHTDIQTLRRSGSFAPKKQNVFVVILKRNCRKPRLCCRIKRWANRNHLARGKVV